MTMEQVRLTAMQMVLQNDPSAPIDILISRADLVTNFITSGDRNIRERN